MYCEWAKSVQDETFFGYLDVLGSSHDGQICLCRLVAPVIGVSHDGLNFKRYGHVYDNRGQS